MGSIVTTTPNEVSAGSLVAEFNTSVIVTDRPDTEAADDLSFCFQHKEYPVKAIVVGWNDDKIAVYSRATVQPATIENLMKFIIAESGVRLRGMKH